MTTADNYRVLAAKLTARARAVDNPEAASEWESLAHAYLRLAEQADRNTTLDAYYETQLPHNHQPKSPLEE